MRYAIVIERAEGNCSADQSGCVATGGTIEEVESQIREAIEFHLDGMREDGTPIPPLPAASITSTLRHNPSLNRTRDKAPRAG